MVEKQQQHTAALARTLETVASFTKTSEKKSDRKKQNNNTLKRNKSKNSTETLWEEEKDKKKQIDENRNEHSQAKRKSGIRSN